MNIFQRFHEAFQKAGSGAAIVSPTGDETLSYRELDELSARFAGYLKGQGLKPGDRVVVQVDKSIGNVGLYLGVLRAGGVYVPLNAGYTSAEVSYFTENARPHAVVCRPQDETAIQAIADQHGIPNVEVLSTSATEGAWANALSTAPDTSIAERSGDDLAAIVYTSGTTGRSKGAMIHHAAMLNNCETLHQIWGFGPDDVMIHALPIFHIHGLFIALHTSLLNGTPIIFLEKFDAELIRENLNRATVLMGVPTFYSRLAALPGFGKDDCETMRLFISGSAPLTAQASDAWTEQTGHRILERYGMSEAGIITSNPLNGDRIAGTVGFPLPGYSARIADEAGREVDRGEVGVIEIKGPSLFRGYWEMPEKTAAEFRPDGYFITGDNAIMDETGRISIVGRAKDLIIAGGYNIYPKEIEQVLDDVPGVLESAVVGTPHPEMGEGVIAILVATGATIPDSELQAAMNESLARFKHPRRFVWISELPRNAMGKVQKAVLREQYADTFQ